MIDAALSEVDHQAPDAFRQIQKQLEEYAVECSILKVWGSEMLDMVVDHVVQIYGGYGYVEDYPAAPLYRDSRINRIFEGTNEVNRLIITGWLLKRAMSGQLALLPAIKRVTDEITEVHTSDVADDSPLSAERKLLSSLKKISLFAAGVASQKHVQDLQDQQEIMGALADCITEVYALESSLLRAEKLWARGSHSAARTATAMTALYAAGAADKVEACAKRVIAAVAEGDTLRMHVAILRRLSKREPANTISLSRLVARHVTTAGRYSL